MQGDLREVMARYPVTVRGVFVENSKDRKAVWQVFTDQGMKSLKKLPPDEGRMEFILAARKHLARGGVNFPEIVRTVDGAAYAEHHGSYYFLTEWILGKVPDYDVLAELEAMVRALACFHKASAGFVPPRGSTVPTELGGWPAQYRKKLQEIADFRKIAAESPGDSFTKMFLESVDHFESRIEKCLDLLAAGRYEAWVREVDRDKSLCHQDFAAGNLSLSGGKIYVFDLDGLTIDLPGRDIRKILNKVLKKRPSWDPELARLMLKWYQAVNPLDRDKLHVTLVDSLFPHLFCGTANKYFLDREPDWSSEKFLAKLHMVIRAEMTKERDLVDLFRWAEEQ